MCLMTSTSRMNVKINEMNQNDIFFFILTSCEFVELEKCDIKLPTKRESIESIFCTLSIKICWPSLRRSSHNGSCTAN